MQGNFELNVRIPLIARNLLGSIGLLANTCELFAARCVEGIEANLEGCERSSQSTLAAATALNPYIGYDKGAAIVKEAAASGRMLRDVALEHGVDPSHLRRGDGPAQDGARFVSLGRADDHERSRRLLTVVALLAALTLSACGGGDDDASSDGGSNTPSASDKAQNRKDMARLIKQAYGPNEKASSGRLDGTIDLEVKGVPRYKGPIEITASGGFELPDGAEAPEFRMDVGLVLNDHAIGGELVLAGGDGLIQLGTTGYKLPESITAKIEAPAVGARQRPREDRGHVLHPPRSLGAQRAHRRRRDRRGRRHRAREGGHPARTLLRGRRAARAAADDAARDRGRRHPASGHPGPARRARALRGVRQRRGLGRQGRPRAAQGAPGGQARRRQEGPQGPRRHDERDADGRGLHQGGRRAAEHQGARQLGRYADLQLALDALGESIRNELRGK